MSLWLAGVVFCLSLALSVISSLVLARDLDKLGARWHLPEGLMGIITALGADTPEISAAVAALIGSRHDLGLGVVLGSNLFNLAALLGVSALIAGEVRIAQAGTLFNGGVAVVVTGIATMLLLGTIPPIWSIVLISVTLLPYTMLSALRAPQIKRLPLPGAVEQFLCDAVEHGHRNARKDEMAPEASGYEMLSTVPALVAIVLASFGLVRSATTLADHWRIPDTIVGLLILSTLTGIPNVLTAIRLALRGRGVAVVTETLNSNSLNVLSGLCLPTLILGLGTVATTTSLSAWWLLGMTVLAVGLTFIREGLHRLGGIAIIVLYIVYVVTVIFGI